VVECRTEWRDAITYCAAPLTVLPANRNAEIPPTFWVVDTYIAEHGIPETHVAVIRYRRSRPEGHLDLEVGWEVAADTRVDGPCSVGILAAGTYVVGRYEGPFLPLEDVAGEVIEWAKSRGLTIDSDQHDGGVRWACRYDLHVTHPEFGATGPSGVVDVCLLLDD